MADAWVVKSGVWRRYTVKEKNEENGKWRILFYFVTHLIGKFIYNILLSSFRHHTRVGNRLRSS